MSEVFPGSLRIAYICADPGVPIFGAKGCSVHVQEVIRAMVGLGHRVTLLATRFDGDVPADLRDHVELLPLPPSPKGDLTAREQLCIQHNAALTEALASAGPFDLVYERYSLWSNGGMRWACNANAPSVLEVNAPLIDEHAEQRGLMDEAAARKVAHDVFSLASAIVTVSSPLTRYVEQFEPESLGRVHVVPNGVNAERFPPPRPRDESRPFTIGFVGSFKRWHGVHVLVDAFQMMEGARLLMVGDGPERKAIEQMIVERGLVDRVQLTGCVPHDQVPSLLAQMDVGIAPYLPCDNFYFSPMKVYEYMAAGVPVIASRTGQMIEAIDDGESGLLVKAGDATELASAIQSLRANPEMRQSMAERARRDVLATRTWNAVVEQILSLPELQFRPAGAAS